MQNKKSRQLTVEEIVFIGKNYHLGPKYVAEELGIDYTRVASVASRLRKKGVKLPKRSPNNPVYSKAVNILIEEQNKNEAN